MSGSVVTPLVRPQETSGLVVVAKVNAAHAALQPQLESHSMGRRYSALVWGAFTPLEVGTSPAALPLRARFA